MSMLIPHFLFFPFPKLLASPLTHQTPAASSFSGEFPAAASLTGVGTYELKWVSTSFRFTLLSYDFGRVKRGFNFSFGV